MEAAEALRRLGGLGTTGQVTGLTSKAKLRAGVRRGAVRRLARGRYGLTDADRHRQAASEITGVLSHLSAAQHWGWPVAWPPDRAWVIVPRNRKVATTLRLRVAVSHADLSEDEILDGVTTPLRTVLDCARKLPFGEALAVADSALRCGAISTEGLRAAAAASRGPGSEQVRRVAAAADGRSANPFESMLRALALDVPGLCVEPQLPVRTGHGLFHPDLVDADRRIIIEADSWTWHTDQQAHGRDCVRYSAMAIAGWLVLRFNWEQVMLSPAHVLRTLRAAAKSRVA
ncbi:hypothetical protein GCM10027020_38460 [Nocardioides salsibiostraticola]